MPAYADAVAAGLSALMNDRPHVHVHAVGEVPGVPAQLRGHDRVTTTAGEFSPATLACWAVHLWAPAMFDGTFADDTRDFVEASHAGVPSVLPAPSRPAIDGYVAPELVISDFESAGDWASAVRRLIDDEHERGRSVAPGGRAVRMPSMVRSRHSRS